MLRFLMFVSCLCATSAVAQEVQILPGHSDFRAPAPGIYDQPMHLVQDWVLGFPDGEGRPELQLSSAIGADGRLVIELSETGLADDSVLAVRQRFDLIRADGGGWTLAAYGFQQRCARGASSDWQAEPCP